MKKLSVVLFLSLYGLIGYGQSSYFGIEAGVNISNQRVSTYNPYSYYSTHQISFHENAVKPSVSVYYHFEFNEKIGARVKASYMGLGFTGGYSDQYNFGKVDINYLMVPITFHYKANKNLSLTAGPYVSFTLNGSRPFNQEILSVYHKNDFGFSFGGEHDIYKGLALSVSYFMGVKNIWLDDQNGNIEYTNRALQISLIYKIKKIITVNQ
jgi:hypothetical protein